MSGVPSECLNTTLAGLRLSSKPVTAWCQQEMTPLETMDSLMTFLQQLVRARGRAGERICKSIAPSIYGHLSIKTGIA